MDSIHSHLTKKVAYLKMLQFYRKEAKLMATKTNPSETQGNNASKYFSVTPHDDPKMGRHLQHLLKETEDPMGKVNSFVAAASRLTGPLGELISKSSIPEADTSDLDEQIEKHTKAISEQKEMETKTASDIDKKIEELQNQRSQLVAPFRAEIEKQSAELAKVSEAKNERIKPVLDAIQEFKNRIKDVAAKHGVTDESTIFALVSVNSPSTSSTPISTGERRGRAGAGKVTLQKGNDTQEFSSLNAARAHVYQLEHGEAPKYQANAAQCQKYLENKGYVVKIAA